MSDNLRKVIGLSTAKYLEDNRPPGSADAGSPTAQGSTGKADPQYAGVPPANLANAPVTVTSRVVPLQSRAVADLNRGDSNHSTFMGDKSPSGQGAGGWVI